MVRKVTPRGIRPFDDFRAALGTAQHASYQGPGSRVRSKSAFEEQKAHLLELYRRFPVRHSFQDSSGQIFDCIPRNEQPALGGEALAEPPDAPGGDGDPPATSAGPLHETRCDDHGNAMHCPKGCVAVRRLTLDELSRFESLSHYLRKGPRGSNRKRAPDEPPQTSSAASSDHQYANARQSVRNLGCSTVLNVWAPNVGADAFFSLSQLWLEAVGPSGVQTVEAGWHVYPGRYGHARPVLFSYCTPDGYVTGSYNTDEHKFVQYSPTCPLGFALDRVSVPDGAQAEIQVTCLFSRGNWWLFIGGTSPAHAIGYYPTSVFGSGPMTTEAAFAAFGGETTGRGAFPPMGSGAFAERGFREAAYQRNLAYYDTGRALRRADVRPEPSWPGRYTIEVGRSSDWGEYIFFGGPGEP
jgi:hypothetical protein